MFLRKVSVKNFKCLSDIEISFEESTSLNRKWTIILGENGTGKSNLLKAIALVTSGSNALGELLDDSDSWIKIGEEKCTINATLSTKKGEERNVSLEINRGDNFSKIISNNESSLTLIDNAIENADRNYFVIGYGSSRKLTSDFFYNYEKSRNGRSANVRNLFDNSSSLNPLASWIIDMDYGSGQNGLDLIRDTLRNFLPGIEFHSIDKRNKKVLFETSDGLIPLDQLSDGYQNMAAWIGDLLFRITDSFGDYTKPLECRGLLLIDEIELHLHPIWQRKLYDFMSMKLPNFQVVSTTHSPLTAQQAGVNELYALKRNEEQEVELIPFIGSPKSLLINQLLMTPVFGLETDESYEVQNAKIDYTNLKSLDVLSLEEQKQLKEVKVKLKNELPKRDLPLVSQKEIDLLERIERDLNIKK